MPKKGTLDISAASNAVTAQPLSQAGGVNLAQQPTTGELGHITIKDQDLVVSLPIANRFNNQIQEIDPAQALRIQRGHHRTNALTFIMGGLALSTAGCALPILAGSIAGGAGFSACGTAGVTVASCLPSAPLCLGGMAAFVSSKKYVRDSHVATQVLRQALNWQSAVPWNNTVAPITEEDLAGLEVVEVYDDAPLRVPPPPTTPPTDLETIEEEAEDSGDGAVYDDVEGHDPQDYEESLPSPTLKVVLREKKVRPLTAGEIKLELYEDVVVEPQQATTKVEGPYEPVTVEPKTESTL